MRENAAAKARRLLSEGRLDVRKVEADEIAAYVRGDSAEVYSVGYTPAGWYCDCSARGRCSHVMALQLVTLVRRGGR